MTRSQTSSGWSRRVISKSLSQKKPLFWIKPEAESARSASRTTMRTAAMKPPLLRKRANFIPRTPSEAHEAAQDVRELRGVESVEYGGKGEHQRHDGPAEEDVVSVRAALHGGDAAEVLEGKQAAVHEPVQDKGHGKAVPEAHDHHGAEAYHRALVLVELLAVQYDEDVLAYPVRERDVPVAPELGEGDGAQGLFEVFRHLEAEEAAHGDGYIGVAGHIEPEQQVAHEAGGEGPPGPRRELRQPREDDVHERKDDDLLEVAADEALEVAREALAAYRLRPRQAAGEIAVAQDRPRGDDGEKEHIVGVVQEIEPLAGVVDVVDGVHGLEHVVGYAGEREEQRQLREELPEADVEEGHRAQQAAADEHHLSPGSLSLPRQVGYAEGDCGVGRVKHGEPLGDIGDEDKVEYGQEALELRLRPIFAGERARGGPEDAASEQPEGDVRLKKPHKSAKPLLHADDLGDLADGVHGVERDVALAYLDPEGLLREHDDVHGAHGV